MSALGFRWKLFLAMMLVVTGVTGAALWVTQRTVQSAYARLFHERFRSETELFTRLQDTRLAAVKDRCLELARSVRLLAAMGERDSALLHKIADDELRDVLTPSGERRGRRPASFFRFLDARGDVVPPPDERAGLTARGPWEESLARAGRAMPSAESQGFGYLALPSAGGASELQEVVITRILDPVERRVQGSLALGFPVPEATAADPGEIRAGVWFEGRLYSKSIAADTLPAITEAIAREGPDAEHGEIHTGVDGVPHRGLFRSLAENPGFPPAYQVCLFSMANALAEEAGMRGRVLGFAVVAVLVAIALSLLLSQGLSTPIRELSRATSAIQEGDYGVRVAVRTRDELGRLAASFNDMAEGLALKEKYRSVLDSIADPDVAEELLAGRVTLGGEVREATILFCDIRGFTALTEHMPPSEVVAFLNEHMTALMHVIHEHHGVVDKFVGDLVMALFGAPKAYGDEAVSAVRCARRMIEARHDVDRRSGRSLAIGIGIATGPVLVGGMGSKDRLAYTALGERVNLASRLCSVAAPMEILVDEETRRRLPDELAAEPVGELELKGFSRPVPVFRVLATEAKGNVA